MPRRPALVITGPTAVGKSQLVESLLAHFPDAFEIVNADALQVYRGLDIGTAKPSKAQLLANKHHLIDIRDPNQSYSLGDFQNDALVAVDQILSQGKIPLLSGGTAFYIKYVISGYLETPQASQELKNYVESALKAGGLDALYVLLQELDPARAAQLHSHDKQRIMRSLEITLASGKKNAEFIRVKTDSLYDCLCFCLTRERSDLITRIAQRTVEMFEAGLGQEVESLFRQGYSPSNSALKAIGYQEFFVQSTDQKYHLRLDLHEIKKQVQIHTAQYAKRQMTFFRSIESLQFIQAPVREQYLAELWQSINMLREKVKKWQDCVNAG